MNNWTLPPTVFNVSAAYGQNRYVPFAFSKENMAVQKMCTNIDSAGWMHFNSEVDFTVKDFFTVNGTVLGLGDRDELREGSVFNDELGSYHWFHHYYTGILVEGSAFMLYEQERRLLLTHAKFVEKLAINIEPSIDEKFALQIVLKDLEIKQDKDYTLGAPVEKVIAYSEISNLNPNNYFLCYRFTIENKTTHESQIVDIDAHKGVIIKKLSTSLGCTHYRKSKQLNGNLEETTEAGIPLKYSPLCAGAADGHAWTLYNGYQSIRTSDRSIFGFLRTL